MKTQSKRDDYRSSKKSGALSREFLHTLRQALESIHEERYFQDERGFQGALLQELGKRWKRGTEDPIIDQEYQKRLKRHGIRIRPDLILHVPFERGLAASRDEGNFIAMELKRHASPETAGQAFENLALMKEKLKYPLTILINVDSEQTFSELCPESISNQTVCFAVRFEGGKTVVREETCVQRGRRDGDE